MAEHSSGATQMIEIRSAVGACLIDPAVGNIRLLTLHDGQRRIAPLHSAPWVDDPATQAMPDLPPVNRTLSGDFFCAPFGASDIEAAPPHGWSANSHWTTVGTGPGTMTLTLDLPVMGARITKTVTLADDAPLLYQGHRIASGQGGLTVAHHPMVRPAGQGRLTTSAKSIAITPAAPLEPGRNRLAVGAACPHLARFPAADGETVDLGHLPIGNAHEDFVTLVEAADSPLGWTAIVREAEDDVVFVLKQPRVLPVTMLWHSNGGRDYAPWSGRHRGVVGIEDGCAAGADGHRAALGDNPISARGVPTHLPLAAGRTHRIAHVIGAMARPAGWTRVADIRIAGDRLVLSGDTGPDRSMPFKRGFLEPEG